MLHRPDTGYLALAAATGADGGRPPSYRSLACLQASGQLGSVQQTSQRRGGSGCDGNGAGGRANQVS